MKEIGEVKERQGFILERLGKVETSLTWMYRIGAVIGAAVIGVLGWIGSLIREIVTNWGSIPVQ